LGKAEGHHSGGLLVLMDILEIAGVDVMEFFNRGMQMRLRLALAKSGMTEVLPVAEGTQSWPTKNLALYRAQGLGCYSQGGEVKQGVPVNKQAVAGWFSRCRASEAHTAIS
jgi:hypothetical protein